MNLLFSLPHISSTCQTTGVDRFDLHLFMRSFSIIDDISSYQDKIPWDIFPKNKCLFTNQETFSKTPIVYISSENDWTDWFD